MAKVGFLRGRPRTARFTVSEVAVDRQESMVLQRKCGHPLHELTDNYWTCGCS